MRAAWVLAGCAGAAHASPSPSPMVPRMLPSRCRIVSTGEVSVRPYPTTTGTPMACRNVCKSPGSHGQQAAHSNSSSANVAD